MATILTGATLTTPPVAAHGTLTFDVPNQVFQCVRDATGVIVSAVTPSIAGADGWSFVSYNLYGSADFGTVDYGWAGWQLFNGHAWLAATPAYPQQFSLGTAGWLGHLQFHANRSNTSSFGHRWWIYAHVLWSDGHTTGHWQSACAS